MTKKDRIPDLTFYEWSILRWTTSDTRNVLDATGIGIYRELLDRCYSQGSIPQDPAQLTGISKCTSEQFSAVWPLIKNNFRTHKKRTDRLVNHAADVYRMNYFRYLKKQALNRKNKGKSKGNEMSNLSNGGNDVNPPPWNQDETRLTKTKRTTTTESWPLAAAAVKKIFSTADADFVGEIAAAAVEVFPALSDSDLADAIATAKTQAPKQYSAGLFLTTVPEVIRTWATQAKSKQTH